MKHDEEGKKGRAKAWWLACFCGPVTPEAPCSWRAQLLPRQASQEELAQPLHKRFIPFSSSTIRLHHHSSSPASSRYVSGLLAITAAMLTAHQKPSSAQKGQTISTSHLKSAPSHPIPPACLLVLHRVPQACTDINLPHLKQPASSPARQVAALPAPPDASPQLWHPRSSSAPARCPYALHRHPSPLQQVAPQACCRGI